MGRGSCAAFKKFMSIEARTNTFSTSAYNVLMNKPKELVSASYKDAEPQVRSVDGSDDYRNASGVT